MSTVNVLASIGVSNVTDMTWVSGLPTDPSAGVRLAMWGGIGATVWKCQVSGAPATPRPAALLTVTPRDT